jgi:hypothetical protein
VGFYAGVVMVVDVDVLFVKPVPTGGSYYTQLNESLNCPFAPPPRLANQRAERGMSDKITNVIISESIIISWWQFQHSF